MAIYHMHIKPIKRSERSSTVAAAYRACAKITDSRTGEVHDYSRKSGLAYSAIFAPKNCTKSFDRDELWNSIEHHHKRRDAILSWEVETAIPNELSIEESEILVAGFSRYICDKYQVVGDANVHDAESHRSDRQKPKNKHLHLMLTACTVSEDGQLGKKQNLFDAIHCQRNKLPKLTEDLRKVWQDMSNEALAKYGARIDHRSLRAQGIDRAPQRHLGPAAHGYEQRKGLKSLKRQRAERLEQYIEGAEAQLSDRFKKRTTELQMQLSKAKVELIKLQPPPLTPQPGGNGRARPRPRLNQGKLDSVTKTTKPPKPPKPR